MKVLFAVNDEKDAEAITRVYQKEYKEIISSKTVYYFNAIIKELQKDKTYDRIVISEDLEMFSSDNYQAVDKFIFEKMDAISDEATNEEGNDIPIILLCMDRRTKNDPLLARLFGLGLYNVLVGQDRSVQKVAALMYKPRSKKEAKAYYKVEAEDVNYSAVSKNDGISENEIQNILNHYKKIGNNIPKCVQSFESIASQYNKEQVKLIAEVLPNSTKVILEENSDLYRKIMGIKGKKAVGTSKLRKAGYEEKEIDLGNKLTQPVIIPTAVSAKKVNKVQSAEEVKKKKAEELARKREEARIAREKAKAEAEAKRKEEERLAKEKAKAEAEAKRKEEARIAREKAKAEAEAKRNEARLAREKAKAEAEAKKKEEERLAKERAEAEEKKKLEEITPPKRGRGRPRKNAVQEISVEDVPVKRKRGRPRKNEVTEKVEEIKENDVLEDKINEENEIIISKNTHKNKNDDLEIENLVSYDDFDDELDNEEVTNDVLDEEDDDIFDFDDFDSNEDEKLEADDSLDIVDEEDDDDEDDIFNFEDEDEELEDDDSLDLVDEEDNEDDTFDFEDEDEELEDDDSLDLVDEDDEDDTFDFEDEDEEIEDDDSLDLVDEEDEDDTFNFEDEDEDLEDDDSLDLVDEEDNEDETFDFEDENEELEDDDSLDLVDEEDDEDDTFDFDDEDEESGNDDSLDLVDEEEDEDDTFDFDDEDEESDEDDTVDLIDEEDEDDTFDFNDEDQDISEEDTSDEIVHNGSFKGINNRNYKYDNDLANSIKDLKETEDNQTYNIDTDNLITSGQKIISFVGTTKNGTSFIVNNLAELFSNRGIKTAILDLTKNKNSYYIYTDNEDELREIAQNSLDKLKDGVAEGINVNKNLSVFTSLPSQDHALDDVTSIIKTLLENYTVVLLDCDFDTDVRYFRASQEMYLVQSLDVLTIQPLTAFLRELKVKNILDTNKLRIIINKNIKVNSLTEKVLIGGMSVYNDPAMTYMTELFNKDTIKYTTIPFEDQVYTKYLESLVNCKITTSGYSKNFIASLNRLGDMVYPTINGKKSKNNFNDYSNQNKNFENTFSKNTSSILNKMKKKY